MPINIQINDGNFSFGPDTGFFYTVNKSINSLLKVEADGTVVDTFPLTMSQLRNPVTELHYDGTFFWTLEDLPSSLGVTIKKWRLHPVKTVALPNVSAPAELRWEDEITLINKPNIIYESSAFAVEHYHLLTAASANAGDTVIRVNDTTNIAIGDILYLGPSSFGGFVGNEEDIIVAGINVVTGDISFLKQGGLENGYLGSDPVDFSKSVWLFNNHSYSGSADNVGSLNEFKYPSKILATVDTGHKYHNVTAADFDQTSINFVRGPMIMKLNLVTITFDLESSLEANLIEADRHSPIIVYDLIADLDSNLYYKLQQKETTEDLDTGLYSTIDFSSDFNFQTQTDLAFVNSTALRFEPTRFAITGSSPKQRKFTIFAQTRDQFNFPVFGKSIQFTAAVSNLGDTGIPGTLDPTIDITNVSGIASTVYTPSLTSNDMILDIQAKVL